MTPVLKNSWIAEHTNGPIGSLVTSSLIRETTKNEYANEGYRFGQKEETYNIVAAHGYFGRLIFLVQVLQYPLRILRQYEKFLKLVEYQVPQWIDLQ